MDFTESTKAVYDKIFKLEPANANKIISYIFQDHGRFEMIRLARSPDALYSLINKAKFDLGLSKQQSMSLPVSISQVNPAAHVSNIPLRFPSRSLVPSPQGSSVSAFTAANQYWDSRVDGERVTNLDFAAPGSSKSIGDDFWLQNEMQLLSLDDPLENPNSVFSSSYFYPEPALGPRTSRRSPSLPEFPVKVCHYFNKGFCKHGSNCRFFHGHPAPETFPQNFCPIRTELSVDEHVVSAGSLEKLEHELTELIKSRNGVPVSIASLPMLYYEKYGQSLQAEGYLTESQRHGKSGYNLTKLLARLKNSIHLIDRPHGQHSVILAEDVPKYLELVGERYHPGGPVSSSRQIYLTFPPESTFTEQDVSCYFSKFGPVQDVRIPCQQERMFGFVTFVSAETVKQILAKGNPHFICRARVLVKPYREKSKLVERKFAEKTQHPLYYASHVSDGDSEFHPTPRLYENSRLIQKQLMEEYQHELNLERRRHSESLQAAKALNHHPCFGYSMDSLKLPEGQPEPLEFETARHFNSLLDFLNNESNSNDKHRHTSNNYNNEVDSEGLNLPDAPFATTVGSSIPTVI